MGWLDIRGLILAFQGLWLHRVRRKPWDPGHILRSQLSCKCHSLTKIALWMLVYH